ncbi:MAG: hypothetical protein V4527_13805 [Pseudomonadota bacterium]
MRLAAIIGLVGLIGTQVLAASTLNSGTVNSYTPAEADRARAAVTKAGYTPETIAMAQDGNFFFNAKQGGQTYQVTVTRAGKVYANGGTAAGM